MSELITISSVRGRMTDNGTVEQPPGQRLLVDAFI